LSKGSGSKRSDEEQQDVSTAGPVKPLRADARRNYDAIVQAAAEEVDRVGAAASLEDIARNAGVGSATLHRHFRSRRDLLQAVFTDRIRGLCARAGELSAEAEPGAALRTWLTELAAYSAATRGLADTLILSTDPAPDTSGCEAMLTVAADTLREKAAAAGAIKPAVTAFDLLSLVNSISFGARTHPTPEAFAEHLLAIALDGITQTAPVSPSQ
jgi:AcrR family transcriptional regulator